METKRAKVIMLPKEDKTAPIKIMQNKLCINSINSPAGFYQHLYFTTDDEIQEGDWFMSAFYGYPIHYTKEWIAKHKDNTVDDLKYHKIVATTDVSLKVFAKYIGEREGFMKELPQPSQAFIEKYCKVGGIDEVELEAVRAYVKGNYTNKCVACGKIFHNTHKYGYICPDHLYVTVDRYNTVTIHPVKDNWSREEVIDLCRSSYDTEIPFKDWLEENF